MEGQKMKLYMLGDRVIRLPYLMVLLSLTACEEDLGVMRIEGTWGAQHIILVADKDGGVVEYDCAHGTIDEAIITDAKGQFDLLGTHTWEHGGPIRSDEEPDTHPARYAGQVTKNNMTLTITLTDSTQVIGPFTITKDDPGRVFKCL